MARRSARQMADEYYPPIQVSEASTWAHPVDYSLPKRGLKARLRKLARGGGRGTRR